MGTTLTMEFFIHRKVPFVKILFYPKPPCSLIWRRGKRSWTPYQTGQIEVNRIFIKNFTTVIAEGRLEIASHQCCSLPPYPDLTHAHSSKRIRGKLPTTIPSIRVACFIAHIHDKEPEQAQKDYNELHDIIKKCLER